MNEAVLDKLNPIERLLARAARELDSVDYVNLGIGLPSKVLAYVDKSHQPFIHSENGVIGAWQQAEKSEMNPMLIDAGGSYISTIPGCSFFDSATSFGMVRSGRLDLCMLGAFEVDEKGNLANWKIPGKFSPGIGGAMELAQKTKRLVILMTHQDKGGNSKIKSHCELPLTAKNCVDLVITDKAVLEINPQGFLVKELAKGVTAEELQAITSADLQFSEVIGVY